MNLRELQEKLAASGHYKGKVDGVAGPKTKQALIDFLTDGPDTSISTGDFEWAANQLSVPVPYVRALYEVESSGKPFIDGRPTILPEPHIFSRLTGHRYDNSHPKISSRQWNRALYPAKQADRYGMLADMIMLDPLAGFGSASYGGFQVLGLHAERLHVGNAMDFAWQESQSERAQLDHFVRFIREDAILWQALRAANWVQVAKRYNGTAYYKNQYDAKLAKAMRKWEQTGG